MKDLICDEFQNAVGDLLIRHYSILDILSKLSESSSRVNRAVVKAVTDCGCIRIQAEKMQIPDSINSYIELRNCLDNHLRGELCPNCQDIIYTELGKMFFYSAALCNCIDISLYDVFIKEYKKVSTLGIFNLT
ncbi:MAG: DUF1573 domain-containing protein [Syntrophomonadaceae bacterium]|nr:DUF1573 domain-containing protein [Syntrophomonadaceae bacterium]